MTRIRKADKIVGRSKQITRGSKMKTSNPSLRGYQVQIKDNGVYCILKTYKTYGKANRRLKEHEAGQGIGRIVQVFYAAQPK